MSADISAVTSQSSSTDGATALAGIKTALTNIVTDVDLKAPSISPSFTTPALGTPASGNLANCTFPTLNQNTSGTASNLSGTPALPNGTTATTQSANDNSTKLATTAYVDTKVISSKQIFCLVSQQISVASGSTTYFSLVGSSGTESALETIMPVAGTMKNLYLYQYETLNGTAGQTIVYTVRKNGADTALTKTATVGDTSAVISDTTHSFSFSAGDKITLKVVAGSITSNTGRCTGAYVEIDPT